MLAIGVNGYGTIGKRVADAVAAQPDMEVAGVVKTRPNHEAANAHDRGYPVYTIDDERRERFASADIPTAGLVEDLVATSDIIVDATPGGVGETYLPTYQDQDTPAIFQGKEAHEMVDASFNARANFAAAAGASYLRVVSCNTTGLARAIAPLQERYDIEKVRATLVRRGGDPDQSERGPINDILPSPKQLPSHHGPDLRTVLPDVEINTLAMTVPATHMHVHAINVTMDAAPNPAAIADLYAEESRIALIPETFDIAGMAGAFEFARDLERPRGDLWESCLWEESISVDGRDLYFFQAIHQESNVIPENIDAIRAIAGTADAEESMRRTDEHLGVGIGVGGKQRAETAPLTE